jgi:hypothetical protein
MTTLINIRLPEDLKYDFQNLCRQRHTYMTTEIIRFIYQFIDQEDKRQASRRHTSDRPLPELNTYGHLVQDPVSKTWMTREEYKRNVWE